MFVRGSSEVLGPALEELAETQGADEESYTGCEGPGPRLSWGGLERPASL